MVKKNVTFRAKQTGFDAWEFVHNALPEIDLAEVDTSVRFLGRTLQAPLLVSCMTGGYAGALTINRDLALACRKAGIALGVGSQRQALEDTAYHRTFAVVREVAPDIPVIGNIGAAEVAALRDAGPIRRLIDLIRADAFAVHLNPLQELLQPEGTPRFRGVLQGIALLVRDLPVPVIVKEIGAGLSADVVRRLLDTGVRIIDVAGAGGTSWAGVELLRAPDTQAEAAFWDWGIPTATAVSDAARLKAPERPFTLIASGGISSAMDAARAIAMGADLAASARPLLRTLRTHGRAALEQHIAHWVRDLRGIMFLTGARTIAELQTRQLIRKERP